MRVLIIDDNESISTMLSKFLTIRGHECVISTDGKKGLVLIDEQKFDCILLDITMPKFSGEDIINYLYETGKIKDKKIIVFTASTIDSSKIQLMLKKGVHSCLLKPVGLDILLTKIEKN